jgi:hypothetical protein
MANCSPTKSLLGGTYLYRSGRRKSSAVWQPIRGLVDVTVLDHCSNRFDFWPDRTV